MKTQQSKLPEKHDVSDKQDEKQNLAKQIREDLKQFSGKSDAWDIQQLLLDYGTMLSGFMIIYGVIRFELSLTFKIPLVIICQIVVAGSLKGLNNLKHEASHNTLFETKEWNDGVQSLFGYLMFQDIESYRTYHFLHHRALNTDEDPESTYKKRWLLLDFKRYFWLIVLIRPICLYYTYDFIRYTFIPFWTNRIRLFEKIWFWATIILLIEITNTWLFCTISLFVPLFILYPVITAFIESTEHTGLTGSVLEVTGGRNRFYNPVVEFILLRHSDGPHGLHHWAPQISGKNLKQAYFYLKDKYGLPFIEALSVYETLNQMLDSKKSDSETISGSSGK